MSVPECFLKAPPLLVDRPMRAFPTIKKPRVMADGMR
jgi:hypothetical protein